MKETKTPKPAPYGNTDAQETLAVDTFKKLVNHAQLKVDVKERDKYPNIDGYVELVNERRVPIGKLEVQIRKLPDDSKTNPKLQCPISLVSYSETVTCNPVLLIGVDVKQNKAYWIHVTKDLVGKLLNENTQKTKVVSFPVNNIIDGKNTKYILEWKSIAETYQRKIQEYGKLKDSYVKLFEKSNPALGVDRRDFQEMHIFLDEINTLLDRKFLTVKKRFYPTAWKIGLAYYEYGDNVISYSLYPIPFNKNDVQIKEINKTLHEQLKNGFTKHYVENPIKLRPKEYATEFVESQVSKILENRLLNHKGNEFLAKEFIFAFIDRFSEQMGLDKRNSYSISEIEEALFYYLPVWVDEAIKFMVRVQRNRVKRYTDCLYRKPYFDPDMLIVQIMEDERKTINQLVRERLGRKNSIPSIPIGNEKFPLGIFYEFFSFLKSKGVKEIDRVYSPRDYSRLRRTGGWIWNFFSPAAVKRNLEIFFDNLPKVYDDMVSQNFPELVEELPLFGDASLTIVVFSVKDKCESFQDSPKIQYFHLSSEKQDGLEIELYKEGETKVPNISHKNLGRSVELNGKRYKLISMSTGILDFIYDDLPMFNFVYTILKENLERYFTNLRKSS